MEVAVVGYGYWGKILKKYLDENNLFKVAGICDPLYVNSIKLEKILNNPNIESVFVCNPIDIHYSTVKILLENKKNVFCEKPLSKSYKESIELFEIAKKNNVTLYVDYIYTNSPSINKIKEMKKKLGKILYIEANINQFGKFYENDDEFDVLGVHLISSINYILDKNIKVEKIIIKKENSKKIIENGSIVFLAEDIAGIMNCNLLSYEKERKIIFTCEKGIMIFNMLGEKTVKIIEHVEKDESFEENLIFEEKIDEVNNLKYVLEEFYNYVISKKSNEKIAIGVAKAIEQINILKNGCNL